MGVEPGHVVGDRFLIEERAGSGGMAAVFRALDRQTGKLVALKLLHGANDEHETRFAREAELLARIVHPGIVGYVAHGVAEGVTWLAMRWVDGDTLSQLLRSRGALGAEFSIELGIAIAEALGAAHAQGVVHRDLKPGNLMVPRGEGAARVLLLDFGIARTIDALSPMTQPGVLVGTPGYVSPEQARAAPNIDARSDLFSLGCVLYACLTGKPPFRGQDLVAVLAKIVFQSTPRVREEARDVHPEIDAVVARLMAKEADDRYPDARSAGEALRALRAVVEAERPSIPTASTSSGISSREARLCSIVIVNVSAEWTAEARADAVAIADRAGGHAEGFAGGALAVKFVSSASAAERALAAARCALTLRDRFPGAPVSLATVRSSLDEGSSVAEAIDRAAELARNAPRSNRHATTPVHIDEASGGLLEERFEVIQVAGELELLRERGDIGEARRLLGVATPCVGRERELAMLDATLAQVIDEGVARAVLVYADAGMGKSRLRQEWLRRVRARDDGIRVWQARADPMGGSSAFALVGQALRRVAAIHDDETVVARQAKLRARVAAVVAPPQVDRVTLFAAELVGAPFAEGDALLDAARADPRLMGDHLRRAFEDWIEAECRQGPLVLVFEDLQWSDPASVRLIDGALARAAELPLLVVGLARPSLRASAPRLWAEHRLQELPLEELSRRSAERLARAVVGEGTAPETIDRILALANGNPFFLEELLRQVAENRSATLPETVLAIVESRLERLAPEARRVLRAAAIFGQSFWPAGVSELVAMDEDDLARWMDTLVQLDLVVPASQGRFADEPELVFRQAIVRDAAYAMLPEEDKALGHRVAGNWLEAMGEQDAGVLSSHFERAGEERRAVGLHRRAAAQMLEGNELKEAIALAERGLRAANDDETRASLHRIVMDAQRWLGNLEGSVRAGLEVLRLAPRASETWASALHGTALGTFKLGRLDEARRWIEAGLDTLSAADASPALAVMGAGLGITALLAGEMGSATAFRTLLAATQLRDHPLARAMVSSFEAFHADADGDLHGQVLNFEAAASAYAAIDDLRGWTMAMANGAYARSLVGDFERADAMLREALPVAELMRLEMVVATIHVDQAVVAERLVKLGEAKNLCDLAIAEHRRQGDVRMEGAARKTLAMTLLRSGQPEAAVTEARAAVELLRNARRDLGHALATLAYALLKAGRSAEALEIATQANELDGSILGSSAGVVMSRLVHARALAANDRASDARHALGAAYLEVTRQAQRFPNETARATFLARVWENDQTVKWAEQSGI
jgi:tetratricopeptide (TPR) repeat protein